MVARPGWIYHTVEGRPPGWLLVARRFVGREAGTSNGPRVPSIGAPTGCAGGLARMIEDDSRAATEAGGAPIRERKASAKAPGHWDRRRTGDRVSPMNRTAPTIEPMPAALRWLMRLGPTNPICVRLVQGGSRRTRHFYIRTGYLGVLIVALLWTLLVGAGGGRLSYTELANAGAASFKLIAYLQIGLITVLSPVFMAGAIAQEANPRTWDILLTTPLSAGQIVLGNLLGRLFFVLALLFSSLPLFAITQYFGGAPASSIFVSYAIAASAAILVGAIAITLSVSRLAGRRAVFAFYISAVSYIALTWALDLWLRKSAGGGVTWLTPLNPFLALEALLAPSSYPTPDAATLAAMGPLARLWFGAPVLSWSLAATGLSVALMTASTVMVRKVGAAGGTIWRRGGATNDAGERIRPSRTVWRNPVAWREASARAGGRAKIAVRWSFIGLGWLWAVVMLLLFDTGAWAPGELRFALLATVWAEVAVVSLIAVNMASTAVSREREDGTLDLLLITPLTPGQYLGGKLRGLVSFLAPMLTVPVGTIMLASLYVLMGGLGANVMVPVAVGTGTMNLPVVLPEGIFVAPLAIVPFVAFCVVVGLQWSLKSKGTLSSVTRTFGVVVVLAGVIGVCAWRAGSDIAIIGPALTCMNPGTAVYTIVRPENGALETLRSSAGGRGVLRLALLLGAITSSAVYFVIIYSLHTSMVRTFDETVRRLAGTR